MQSQSSSTPKSSTTTAPGNSQTNAEPPPSPKRFFVGRSNKPPFTFTTGHIQVIGCSRRWVKEGTIDEEVYLRDQAGEDGVSHDSPTLKREVIVKDRAVKLGFEVIDLTMIDDNDHDSHSVSSTPPLASISSQRRRDEPRLWTRKQEIYLFKAQLRYGQGKQWQKVVHTVNKAERLARPFTLQECQAKWLEVRKRAFSRQEWT